MAIARWVQATLFDDTPAVLEAHQPNAPGDDGGAYPRRRLSYARVTRDPQVALEYDRSHRLSARHTYQLAHALSDEQIEHLRRVVNCGAH